MIAAMFPGVGFGNKAPQLIPAADSAQAAVRIACLPCAIVREQDQRAFGRWRTRDDVLAALTLLQANQ